MHLLSAQAGAIQQEGEAIDLAQSPGTCIFASSADSELAMLAGAADRAGESGLRLANILRLSNNLSVDMWLEQTVAHARLVVLRRLCFVFFFLLLCYGGIVLRQTTRRTVAPARTSSRREMWQIDLDPAGATYLRHTLLA